MEKGPSTFAEYWTSEFSEVEHFKHAKEFGFTKLEDYSKAAKNFANKRSGNIKIFKSRNGSIYKYDIETKEFIIISKDGKIVTYFKTSYRYFIKEYERKGSYWIKGGESE